MLSESIYKESKITLLKRLLEEKQKELQERNNLNKKNKSKYSKWYSFTIIVLFFALITQLGFIKNPDKILFKTKATDLKNNFTELALLYQNQKEKDSLKLLEIQDKIAYFQEKKEIASILREQEIMDSLHFENPELVVTVHYSKNNDKKAKFLQKLKKSDVKINTFKDYNTKEPEQKKVINKKKLVSTEKYYLATDKFAVYPKCANRSSEVKKRKCLNSKVKKFISKKINKTIFKTEGVKRVDILVGINKKGIAKPLRIRGANNKLQKNDIEKAIAALPKFISGRENNIKVGVKFTLSIPF